MLTFQCVRGHLESIARSHNGLTRLPRPLVTTLEHGKRLLDLIPGRSLGQYNREVGPERVASTETVIAFSDGTLQSWIDSGLVSYKTWHTQEDGKVCIFCRQMNGISAKVDEPWFSKGETLHFDGYSLVLDYDDIEGPPIHPGCRCFMDFVLEDRNDN